LKQIDYRASFKKNRIEIGALYGVEKAAAKNKPAISKVHPTLLGDPMKLSLTGYAGGGSPLLLCISISNASSSLSTSVVVLERRTGIS